MMDFIINLLKAKNNDNSFLDNQNYDDELYWEEIEEQWADFEIDHKIDNDLPW